MRRALPSERKTLVRLYTETINNDTLISAYLKRNIISNNVYVITNLDDDILGMYVFSKSRLPNPYSSNRNKDIYYWLDQISVWPNEQHKGYGNQLMKHFLTIKAKEFRLVCEPKLEKFYINYGFNKVKTITHNGRKQLIMHKIIH